ncbi:MAG: prolyl oligopeptidase family serine peptidase [Pseudomonadota bacterium]
MNAGKPYGSWPSDLTAAALTQGVKDFVDLQAVGDALIYLESRPEEGGRCTLVLYSERGGRELTPAPYNVRSRAHEYGGGAFRATDRGLFFVNFEDQNLYRLDWRDEGAQPVSLTEGDASQRFADMDVAADGTLLAAVCERHTDDGVVNELIAIDLNDHSQSTLHCGHDFYAAPRFAPDASADGGALAFIFWDHPNMPWDGTELHVLNPADPATPSRRVAGGLNEAVVQPFWNSAGDLHFASDRSGFWNLYRWDGAAERRLFEDDAEYASPPWVFGMQDCIAAGDGQLIAVRSAVDGTTLELIKAGDRQTLCSDFAGYGGLSMIGGVVHFIAGRRDGFPALVALDLATRDKRVLAQAGELPFDGARLSIATPMSLNNRHGQQIYANVYLPQTEGRTTDAGSLPPLLVLSHGGPTASSGTSLSLRIQYYTTRGWAVADVNYRGSTGFGRAYRDALKDQWGIADVEDCEDVARALSDQGLVDPQRLAIRGGSAGGYTTLAALTFGSTFQAGASHYGIGDISALAADTHKFEARYIDNLIPQDEWAARSPINSVDRLSCPVIFFQGTEDRVVPPNQAEAMVRALQAKSLPVAHVLFEGEGHGFRQAPNIQRAAAAEYQFFCAVFGIECPDPPVELVIDNAENLG